MLTPAKIATEMLSRSENDILEAEIVQNFLLNETMEGAGVVANNFYESLKLKLEDHRHSNLTSLLLYLHDMENWNEQSKFLIPTKASIINLGTELIRRLFDDQDVSGNKQQKLEEIPSTSKSRESFEDKLYGKLKQSIGSATISNQTKLNGNPNDNIKKEFQCYEQTQKRTPILQKLYEALLTVQPTSTQSERNFSIARRIVTKTRSSHVDDTVDMFCFLKSYFGHCEK